MPGHRRGGAAVAAPLPAAEVARILAELHQAGLLHGTVEPGHVVSTVGAAPILVGLGRGGAV